MLCQKQTKSFVFSHSIRIYGRTINPHGTVVLMAATSQTLSLPLRGRASVNTDAMNPLLISTISSQAHTSYSTLYIDEGYRVTTRSEEALAESKRSQKPEQQVGRDVTNQREVTGESLHCGCCGRLQPQILAVELKPAVRRKKEQDMSRQTDGWQAQVGT